MVLSRSSTCCVSVATVRSSACTGGCGKQAAGLVGLTPGSSSLALRCKGKLKGNAHRPPSRQVAAPGSPPQSARRVPAPRAAWRAAPAPPCRPAARAAPAAPAPGCCAPPAAGVGRGGMLKKRLVGAGPAGHGPPTSPCQTLQHAAPPQRQVLRQLGCLSHVGGLPADVARMLALHRHLRCKAQARIGRGSGQQSARARRPSCMLGSQHGVAPVALHPLSSPGRLPSCPAGGYGSPPASPPRAGPPRRAQRVGRTPPGRVAGRGRGLVCEAGGMVGAGAGAAGAHVGAGAGAQTWPTQRGCWNPHPVVLAVRQPHSRLTSSVLEISYA